MQSKDVIRIYTTNNELYNDDFVSLNKIFLVCKSVKDKYSMVNEFIRNSFVSEDYLGYYFLDRYDYKNDCLIIRESNRFYFDKDGSYYSFKLDDGNIVVDSTHSSDDNNDNIDNIISKHCETIGSAIELFSKFKNFKTIKGNNIACYNSNLFIDIDDYNLTLKSFHDKNNVVFKVEKNYHFDDNNFTTNIPEVIRFYKEYENKILNNILVRKNDLPEWCINAIKLYDYEHRSLFSKIKDDLKDILSNRNKKDNIISDTIISEVVNSENKNLIDDLEIKISDMLFRLSSLKEKEDNYERINISSDLLFVKVDDHLEIKKDFIPYLKYIDLSLISFDNVYVSGIDFTDSNVSMINPQNVYNKDLSHCTFDDCDKKDNSIPFNFYTDFNGVDLRGTVINDKNCDFEYNLKGAIVDQNTSITYGKGTLNKKKIKK